MVAIPQKLTPEEYLELEAQSSTKHEYINGEIYAMAGTTDTHNTICGNVYMLMRNHLRGTDCRVYFADVKVRVESKNCFYYPDVLVTCNPEDRQTNTYKSFPKLIIEVLSESTEAFDRGNKFNDYQSLDSLEEYVLLNNQQQRVEIFRRNADSTWQFLTYTPQQETCILQSIELQLKFSEIYEDVEFES